MLSKTSFSLYRVRSDADVPLRSRVPHLGYFSTSAGNAEHAEKVSVADMPYTLVPAHHGPQSTQYLTKPRNTKGSFGQLWDDQQLYLRMGAHDNSTQRYGVHYIQERGGAPLRVGADYSLARVTMDLLHADGTVPHPAAPPVRFVAVRVSGVGGGGPPVAMMFSDKSTRKVFHRALPECSCACEGKERVAVSRMWRQLQGMSAAGALPALEGGVLLLLVAVSDLPPGGERAMRLGASFPAPGVVTTAAAASAALGCPGVAAAGSPVGGTHQAVSPCFMIRSHFTFKKASPTSTADCSVLPLAPPTHLPPLPRVAATVDGSDTLPGGRGLHAGRVGMHSGAQQAVWVDTAAAGRVVGVMPPCAGEPCVLCGGAGDSGASDVPVLVQVADGGDQYVCVATACTDVGGGAAGGGGGVGVVLYSLRRGGAGQATDASVGPDWVWMWPPGKCAYSFLDAPVGCDEDMASSACMPELGLGMPGAPPADTTAVSGDTWTASTCSFTSSSGGSSKRSRSPDPTSWGVDVGACHPGKHARGAVSPVPGGGSSSSEGEDGQAFSWAGDQLSTALLTSPAAAPVPASQDGLLTPDFMQDFCCEDESSQQ